LPGLRLEASDVSAGGVSAGDVIRGFRVRSKVVCQSWCATVLEVVVVVRTVSAVSECVAVYVTRLVGSLESVQAGLEPPSTTLPADTNVTARLRTSEDREMILVIAIMLNVRKLR